MNYTEYKYINLYSAYVRNFKKVGNDKFQFSCPICGDSKKNTRKARGYVFDNKTLSVYKCHNCGISTTFSKLLQQTQPQLYNDYVFEKFGNKIKHEEFVITKPLDSLFDINKSDIKFLLQSCDSLEISHPARIYLSNRQVPTDKFSEIYYTDDLNILKRIFTNYEETFFPQENRLVFPVYNIRNQLTAVISRAMNANSKLRYIILKSSDESQLLYGLNKLNFNKQKYVVEGPIDSLFVSNSVAVSGADLQKCINMFDDNTTYIFDNQPRNREIVKRMKNIADMQKNLVIWPENIVEKDINDMVLKNINVNEIINKHTYKGLRAMTEIAKWSKVK